MMTTVDKIETLEETLTHAISLHQTGNIKGAERLYRKILKDFPNQPNASHNLGIIALECADTEHSLKLFKTALEADPDEHQYWLSYIDALIQANQRDLARDVLRYGMEGGLTGKDVENLYYRLHGQNIAPKKSESKKSKGLIPQTEIDQLVTLFNHGDLRACEANARQLTRQYPRDSFGWKVLATTLQQTKRCKEGLDAFKKALSLNPKDTETYFNLGNLHMDMGDIKEAKKSYQKAIQLDASFIKAYFNLGCLLSDQGDLDAAISLFKKVLKLDNKNAPAHYHLANVLRLQGLVEEAEQEYLQVIQYDQNMLEAYIGLSELYQSQAKLSVAEDTLRSGINNLPNAFALYNNLGVLLRGMGRLEEAEDILMKCLSINPEMSAGYNNLGLVMMAQRRYLDAEAAFRYALELKPDSIQATNNLGLVFRDCGRMEEAIKQFEHALELNPDYAEAHCNIGLMYNAQGKAKEAEIAFQKAIALQPKMAQAHNNLGITLKSHWRLQEAEQALRNAIEVSPDYAEAHSNLGSVLKDSGNLTDAEASYRKAIELKPDYAAAYSNLLFCITHNANIDKATLLKEHLRFGKVFESPLKASWQPHDLDKDPNRSLNIGFVSADLRNHAVAYFVEPIFANLAQYPQLNLFAYSNSDTFDAISTRLQPYFKTWRNVVRLDDDILANQIRKDKIDILVDLSGHTSGHRLLTFARKPAPIQATLIGYPGTTGLEAMDYYLADKYLMPIGQMDDQFTEKLVQLPAAAPFMPEENAPPVSALPALSNGYVTFGSFNRHSKLSPAVINVWADLIRAVPNSKMILGALAMDGDSEEIVEWFAEAGISKDRLILHKRSDMATYLSLHHQIDICLDAFPYNGGTTSWHAMWMGVPTLTIAGDKVSSRIGAGIMGNLGLDQFVVKNAAAFVEQGIFWASHLDMLSEIRSGLRARFAKSPTGDPKIISAGFERALRIMWQRWCQNQLPQSFEVSLQEVGYRQESQLRKNADSTIYVTQPLLPELSDYLPYLEQIWKNKFLTNGGPFHQQLEQALCDYLGVSHIALFTNGTLALLTALQSLRISGEVITTPYSFVATAHALLWNNIKPVFVDIDPVSLNMDPTKIEAAITPQTTAILPVHCYGHPCETEKIQQIADNYNLKVIYDAAHAFGVKKDGKSVLTHGDLSILSFHATKVFNTFEGGAIICPDAKTKMRIDHLKNFGFVDEQTVVATGINGKMSEINAAFGLLQLKGIDAALDKRKSIDAQYRALLGDIHGIYCVPNAGEEVANYSYFPILVKPEYPSSRDALYQKLRQANIFARRYFYPLISDFPMYRGLSSAHWDNLAVARQAANEVICLPIFPDLTTDQIERIVSVIRG